MLRDTDCGWVSKPFWKHLCKKIQAKIKEQGFGPFLNLSSLKADKSLLMALAERWSPMTRTFHLPMREIGLPQMRKIGLPQIDIYMMTGLSMDGKLSYATLSLTKIHINNEF